MAVKIDGMTNVLVVYNSEDADEIDVRLRMEKIACVRNGSVPENTAIF